MMNNIQSWSRDVGRKIGCVGILILAGFVGFLLPVPLGSWESATVDAFVTMALLVFAWGAFHLVRPIRYNRKWQVAGYVAIPLVWICLVAALGCWLHHIQGIFYQGLDEFIL